MGILSAVGAFGGQTMTAPLARVLVKRPEPAFGEADPGRWHYAGRPDLDRARREHDAFTALLAEAGAEVVGHDAPQPGRADAIYVFDPVLLTDAGAVILRMGKELRRGEEEAMAARLVELGVPILFALTGDARAEGGDLLWLDRRTLAVGQGFRTNREGLAQLAAGLEPLGIATLPVELPFFGGPRACLHLLSLVSLLDSALALVYPPLVPVSFWRELRRRGFELVEVPEGELETMGPNVLTLAPRRCLALAGSPRTRRRLEAAGCEVATYRGEEISRKAEGGPTCLTLPLLRSGAPAPEAPPAG